MDAWIWVIIAVAVVLVIGLLVSGLVRRNRSQRLQRGFGPEYERELERKGGRREAEAELTERKERREALDIRPLADDARERYARSWRATQGRFVDEPVGAVAEAEQAVVEVMRERGYPVDDFDQRAADISVDHPVVVENYRAAHAISTRAVAGEATTEDRRQAMVHYRALFEELLGSADPRREGQAPSETTPEVRQ
jgi:hypothetical protein